MSQIKTISDIPSNKNLDISRELIAANGKRPLLHSLRLGKSVVGPKFSWPEQVYSSPGSELTANYSTGGSIAVSDVASFLVGDLIHIEDHKDSDHIEIISRISAITPASKTLTISVVRGSDTNITRNTSAPQKVRLTRPRADNSLSNTGGTKIPTLASSYLQLHQVDLELGEKAIRAARGGQFQGIDDLVLRGLEQKIDELTWSVYQSILYGYGQDEVSGKSASTKGLLEFINTTSLINRVDVKSKRVSETHINDLVEKLIFQGLPEKEHRLLLMHPSNARELAKIRRKKVSYLHEKGRLGGAVHTYISDFSNIGEMEIIVDPQMERSTVLLISPQWVELVPASGMPVAALSDATVPGQYGKKYTLRAELGLKVMYASQFHGALVNIDPDAA